MWTYIDRRYGSCQNQWIHSRNISHTLDQETGGQQSQWYRTDRQQVCRSSFLGTVRHYDCQIASLSAVLQIQVHGGHSNDESASELQFESVVINLNIAEKNWLLQNPSPCHYMEFCFEELKPQILPWKCPRGTVSSLIVLLILELEKLSRSSWFNEKFYWKIDHG